MFWVRAYNSLRCYWGSVSVCSGRLYTTYAADVVGGFVYGRGPIVHIITLLLPDSHRMPIALTQISPRVNAGS